MRRAVLTLILVAGCGLDLTGAALVGDAGTAPDGSPITTLDASKLTDDADVRDANVPGDGNGPDASDAGTTSDAGDAGTTGDAGDAGDAGSVCTGCTGFCAAGSCKQPVLWLRADVGVTEADPFAWADQSGNGNDVKTNQSASSAPVWYPTSVNGAHPAIRFARNARLVSGAAKTFKPGTADVTWFHVSRNAGGNPTDKNQVFGTINPALNFSGITAGYAKDNHPYGMYRQLVDFPTTMTQASLNSWDVIDMRRQQTHHEIRRSGGPPVTADSATAIDIQGGVWTVGSQEPNGTEWFNGDIAEIVVFVTGFTDSERSAVAHQLGDRYGISIAN